MTTLIPPDYAAWLAELKTTIRTARLKASLAVNRELVLLYWRIGQEILERQSAQGWGAKVIDQLARDLRAEFSDMRGFSRTNLLYMRAFASSWPEEAIVHQLGGQIPWRHNCVIIDQVKDRPTREWYIRKTIENGWSRSVLELQIETAAHRRVGAAQTNFDRALPSPQSDLARDILKDPYTFDFLGITDASNERTIEKALVLRLRDFLIELGVGFAFVGSQYRLEVEGDEFFMDLLFYHTRLHCYVVIELKNTAFRPEYVGKLNFYLAAVDDLVRNQTVDAPTIGLVLCKSKKGTVVEYALRDINTPMGVSTYRTALPDAMAGVLPSIEALTEELRALQNDDQDDLEPDLLKHCTLHGGYAFRANTREHWSRPSPSTARGLPINVDYFYSSRVRFQETSTKPLISCATGNAACFLLSICRGIVKVHTTLDAVGRPRRRAGLLIG
jgi:predicted nuclease of restriction endonuclease-like (RecB) superfamily